MKHHNVDDGREYICWSKNNPKATILYLHGFTSSYRANNLFALNNVFDNYNYCGFNLRYHRDNKETFYIYKRSFKFYTNEIIDFILKYDFKDVIIIGHSMGAGLAAMVAKKLNKRVSGIILLNGINPSIFLNYKLLKYFKLSYTKNIDELGWLNFSDYQHVIETSPLRDEIIAEFKRALERKVTFIKIGAKIIEPKLYVKLKYILDNLNIPILAIMSSEDEVLPYNLSQRYYQDIIKHNKKLTTATIKGAGHCSMIEDFETYNSLVWNFINHTLEDGNN